MKPELLERRDRLREATHWMLRLCARINRLTPDDPVTEEALDWLVANYLAGKPEVSRREVA